MLFDSATISALRDDALEAERLGRLTDKQLEIIRARKWFKLFVPVQLGGLGLSLGEVLRIEEALAWIDGSVGWVVTLCAGAGWFVGFADQDFARSLLEDYKFCIAGSGAVGTANAVPGGFRINGSWKYASGSLHATAFTVNCSVNGEVNSFFLLPGEITVHRTWNSMGMIATGSNSFEAKDQHAGPERRFIIKPENAVLKDAIYQYPFLQLAETTLAMNLSGMALRFIELSGHKTEALDHCRKEFFDVVDNNIVSKVSAVSHNLVKTCREIVNSVYPQLGLSAADRDREINRVWRNFHTAGQHSLFHVRNAT
jgi:alkylation response protein AidB-like acyl-CoA dehydrogenase